MPFDLSIIRMSSPLLLSPAVTIGLISSAAIVILLLLLLAVNVTITDAQQQQQLPTSQLAAIENSTTSLFQNMEDSFRVQVPEGWVIHDVNNTGSILSNESMQGYGILAQLCPQEEEEEDQAALPDATGNNNNSSSDTFSSRSCDQSEQQHIIHIVRYSDLDSRMQ